MSIRNTITELQALNASIDLSAILPTGRTLTTPDVDSMPARLNASDLPVAIVWPGSADTRQKGIDHKRSDRLFRVAVYALPAELGSGGAAEGWALTIDLLDAFLTAYNTAANLTLHTDTYTASLRPAEASPYTDNGVDILAYPPPATGSEGWPHFFGFELVVAVMEIG